MCVSHCRVLVVDDNPVFLAMVGELLADLPGIQVIALVSSGREALERVEDLDPDLIVTDLSMPEIGGLELARQLSRSTNAPPVVIMTVDAQPRYQAAALAAGAAGFLSKADLVIQLPILIHHLLPHFGSLLRDQSSGEE